jgi:6-hydroxycyclohex-1-ene-1-carbonyl-CoA dehydrogenase
MRIRAWTVREAGRPMVLEERDVAPGTGDVIVKVAGCGVCHTDLGFYYDGVPTRHGFPLTLGHEVAGVVEEAGPGAESWLGRAVVVPAVIPCGACDACRAGRGPICPTQVFPGSDVHGGFASHLCVPARGLCPVPPLDDRERNVAGLDLQSLSVIADAVSTPYQAVLRSGLRTGDVAVFVGAGGIGGFGVQIAAALGATVVAVDVDAARLEALRPHGAARLLDASSMDFKDLRKAVRRFADERGVPSWHWKIFETSGTPQGQATAFGLLGHGSHLSIVGFTSKTVEIRLSNVMAFDATVQGNWACVPEHYPAVVDLVLSGRIAVAPFIETRPMASINETFAELHERRVARRVVLVPER